MTHGFRAGAAVLALCLAPFLRPLDTAHAAPGAQLLYLQQCAPCHGVSGRGDGPNAAIFVSKPRDLRGDFLDKYPTNDLVRRILDGRPLELALDLPAMRARAADVESLIAYMQRLPEVDWHTADQGSAVYITRCEPCHGAYGRSTGALPPGVRAPRDFSDPAFQHAMSDAELVTAARHGRAGMPALTPRVTEEQARQVTTFVRLLSPGFTTYSEYCADCHGAHGTGTGSFAEVAPAPTVIFDRAYFARCDPEALRGTVWHMLDEHQPSMPHFRGVISPAQAQAIIDDLKKRRNRGRPHGESSRTGR
ncbi:MAG: c-type cytochrome [Burkholderiales bacterium]